MSRRLAAVLAASLVATLAACADDPAAPSPRALGARRSLGDTAAAPAPALVVTPDTSRVVAGRTTRLVARDSAGQAADSVAWISSDTAVATVDSAGVVTGVALGKATILARRGADSATAVVTVHDASVYRVAIAPSAVTVIAGDTVAMAATPLDAQDAAVKGAAVRWSSSDTTVAAIDPETGELRALAAGSAWAVVTSAGRRDSARVDVSPRITGLRVLVPLDTVEALEETRQLQAVHVDSAGRVVTHGQALARRAVRWASSDTTIATIDSVSGELFGLDRGTVTITATSTSTSPDDSTLADSVTRVVVIKYRHVVAGTEHACDLASGGIAWCWGLNGKDGRIGLADLADEARSAVPVRVPGNHRFASLAAYGRVTCGLEGDGKAWCWGNNGWGMLATGAVYQSATPLLVSEKLRFRSIAVGDEHVCAIATDDKGYCWGYNGWAQMGTGRTGSYSEPTLAFGGMTLAAITSGAGFTCALTPKGEAYCAGASGWGQLGDGTKISFGNTYERAPVAVVGGRTFTQIRASNQYACALTASGASWCWGNNSGGTFGAASPSESSKPVATDGGITFRSIATGYAHACGVATDDALYCWGSNRDGQLANDAIQNGTKAPVRAAAKLKFADVAVANVATGSGNFTCGIAADRLTTLCWGRNVNGQLGNGATAPAGTPNVTPSIVVGQKPK